MWVLSRRVVVVLVGELRDKSERSLCWTAAPDLFAALVVMARALRAPLL